MADISVPSEYAPAWTTWLGELAPGTADEQFAFLRALRIRVRESDLDGLEERVRHQLVAAFCVPEARVASLFNSLVKALMKWTTGHPHVLRIDLRRLSEQDVRALYFASRSRIPPEQADGAVRTIIEHALGNTLATVFGVAEAERRDDLVALANTLRERRLADGLEAYYSAIWQHMLGVAGGREKFETFDFSDGN